MITMLKTKSQTSTYDEAGYSYEIGPTHLTERKAIDKYREAKNADPDALVALDDLDCGHWTVSVYSTEEEKQAFLTQKLAGIFRHTLAMLAKLSR